MRTNDFDVEALFESVGEFRAKIIADGDKPSAEKWTANTDHRNRMHHDVRELYCLKTGCERWNFPFSVDGVVNAFLRFRKEAKNRQTEKKPEKLFP